MRSWQAGEVVDAFKRYARAFQSLDAEAVASHFHEPALIISRYGIQAALTLADVVRAYATVMEEARRRGYATTEFFRLTEHRLGDELAIVSGTGSWKTAAGEELDRSAMLYTFARGHQGWQIVVATIHDAAKVLPLG